MQVKCEYCGAWIEDTAEKCPNCDGANAKLARVAKKTPVTIEELQSWYKARNLPPYEQTRFFIGQNYTKPKAFGIYRDGENYIVYKNKADGSRAIRYKGTDEAYAVNEIYLRLKEEILNQKNVNSNRKSSPSPQPYNRSGSFSGDGCIGSGCIGGCSGCLYTVLGRTGLIVFAAVALIFVFAMIGAAIDSKYPHSHAYYLTDDKSTIYYHENKLPNGDYEWWMTPVEAPEWTRNDTSPDNNGFPDGLTKDNLCGDIGSYSDMIGEAGLSQNNISDYKTSVYSISNCHDYLDAHHYAPSSSSYYYINGQSYYYLNDSHGASYGIKDNSGWYRYNDDSGWEYYCSSNDHEALGDELWYDDEDYCAGSDYKAYEAYVSGNVYNFSDTEAAAWSTAAMAQTFEDTTWYGEKTAADEAYNDYISKQSSSSSSRDDDWSSDSGWDWDSSSDSWDSGSTDWDSDW